MYAYPTEFPFDAAELIASAIRNPGSVKCSDVCHANWNMEGYCLGQGCTMAPPREGASLDEAKKQLLTMLDGAKVSAGMKAIDWAKLLTILKTVMDWLIIILNPPTPVPAP